MSCKKIKSSAVVGKSLALSVAIVNPAAENTLSEGAEVAGIHKILLARRARLGNWDWLIRHHADGLVKLPS